jgi:hypothetical protein
MSPTSSLVDELEQNARGRFVSWDPALWQQFVEGPARSLSERLAARGVANESQPVFESYLRLACEAIGMGYLFPATAGSANVFSLFWNKLVPDHLADVPNEARSSTLAACWNLGENLESAPLWTRRIFYRTCAQLESLGDLENVVAKVTADATSEPAQRLTAVKRLAWVHLGQEDKRFLPGMVHYLAPRVLCVHDRERTGGGGRDAVTYGVWLADPPTFLGPMGCKEPPQPGAIEDSTLVQATQLDPRLDEPYDATANGFSAAITLTTSQFVIALLP